MEELFYKNINLWFCPTEESVEHGRIAHAYLLKATQERANMR